MADGLAFRCCGLAPNADSRDDLHGGGMPQVGLTEWQQQVDIQPYANHVCRLREQRLRAFCELVTVVPATREPRA